MRKLLIISVLFAIASVSSAQKVYRTDKRYEADVRVYVVGHAYEADLIVYKADRAYMATGNKGIWYFCRAPYEAQKKIFFAQWGYDAELKIMFTDKEYEAGWRNEKKKSLMESPR